MFKSLFALAVLSSVALPFGATSVLANADDAAWIKRCVADNANEGAKETVVAAYCACMNNKMSSNETLSVTAWEKTHPDEQAACSKEAGWK
jgi:hypothetical protein